jgi:hypothetical protein
MLHEILIQQCELKCKKKNNNNNKIRVPGEYETEMAGDSGNTLHTNLSALEIKVSELELPFITNC